MEKSSFYRFLGVSTSKSLVNEAFPRWMNVLEKDISLQTFDLPIGSSEKSYLQYCSELKHPNVVGSLITSHKTEIYEYCRGQFSILSNEATKLREISAIRNTDTLGELHGHNTDLEGARRSFEKLSVQNDNWISGSREVVIIGAGGACISILHCIQEHFPEVEKVSVTEISQERITTAKEIADNNSFRAEFFLSSETERRIANSGKAPLVINASGVGKDTPGSPVSNTSCFPKNSTFWELNYRGDRELFFRLRDQSGSANFTIEDGWQFFVDGWTFNILFVLSIVPDDNIVEEMRRCVKSLRT